VQRLAAKTDPVTADMIWFAVLTGLRRGEMLALRPEQIRGDVLVLESSTKSGRPRGIPMPPRAARIAARRLPWGVAYWQLRKRFDAARDDAGLPHVHWHDLRHTYGSWLAQSGQPMTAIRDLMGHSSVSVTSRYSHLAPEHLRAAVKSLPGWERAGKKLAAGRSRKAA
jgi:integrase